MSCLANITNNGEWTQDINGQHNFFVKVLNGMCYINITNLPIEMTTTQYQMIAPNGLPKPKNAVYVNAINGGNVAEGLLILIGTDGSATLLAMSAGSKGVISSFTYLLA